MKQRCPKCGSDKITKYEEDLPFIKCNYCGYDQMKPESMPSDKRKS